MPVLGDALNRRQFSMVLGSLSVLPVGALLHARSALGADQGGAVAEPGKAYFLFDEAVSQVLPESGFHSRIALKDSIIELVNHGVIDSKKFLAAYAKGEALPKELESVLIKPADRQILLTRNNAPHYVNVLWPIGLANKMAANAESPLLGEYLFNYASTGGWTLGREANGAAYFNKFAIVRLSREQEARVVHIAKQTYRPCCDNSTFYQDCNHGSALLGLLQLGASQGLTDGELYKEAVAFNSFWFPDYYVRTALFFRMFKQTNWSDLSAETILSYDYSALDPWLKNVAAYIEKVPGLIPPAPGGGANCGI